MNIANSFWSGRSRPFAFLISKQRNRPSECRNPQMSGKPRGNNIIVCPDSVRILPALLRNTVKPFFDRASMISVWILCSLLMWLPPICVGQCRVILVPTSRQSLGTQGLCRQCSQCRHFWPFLYIRLFIFNLRYMKKSIHNPTHPKGEKGLRCLHYPTQPYIPYIRYFWGWLVTISNGFSKFLKLRPT